MRLYDNKSPEPNSLVSISDEKPLHMRPFRGQVSYRTHPSFQSQTRSRSTCDTEVRDRSEGKWPVSISDEKPLHMRPKVAYALFWLDKLFQSQTRSRSTCDFSSGAAREDRKAFQSQTRSRSTCDYNIMGNDVQVVSFNLRREAAPHATSSNTLASDSLISVSISDEKPLHMRLGQFVPESRGAWGVSISDEKPLHMRRAGCYRTPQLSPPFQSQTRSRSTCDA